MARPRILDQKIMSKVAKKLGKKNITAINGMVSRKASQLGISAEAALILLAKENGIGASTYQRNLDPMKQAEVRDALPAIFAPSTRTVTSGRQLKHKGARQTTKRASLKSAIEYLIQDQELRDRCEDILLASSKFDRPINQATLVLEDRIRNKAKPAAKLVGENLVSFAFNESLSKTVLRVASNDADDQRGFTQILRGIVPTGILAPVQKAATEVVNRIRDYWHIDLLDDDNETTSAENNTSTIILFTVDGHKLLFTGDAGKTALLNAIAYADGLGISLTGMSFLDVPHHGSKRNLNSKILKRMNATTAFISAPPEGDKHPAKKVVNALKKHGSTVYTNRLSIINHNHNAPNRGWVAATEEPFYDIVEE